MYLANVYCSLRENEAYVAASRLKLLVLLAWSDVLDMDAALRRLNLQSELIYERAVVLGRVRVSRVLLTQLERFSDALRVLAIDVRDDCAAEAFCMHGGCVLPYFSAADAMKTAHMHAFAALLPQRRSLPVSPAAQMSLLHELLGIYMESQDEYVHNQKATNAVVTCAHPQLTCSTRSSASMCSMCWKGCRHTGLCTTSSGFLYVHYSSCSTTAGTCK